MHRILLAVAASLVVALSSVALASGAPRRTVATARSHAGTTATPPRMRLRSFVCQRALAPTSRSISVEAVMRPVAHTKTMQVRFDLLSRPRSNGGYVTVHGGDLGVWLSPDGQPTLGSRPGDIWTISHPVTGLPAPSVYRYRVLFRWLGARGHVLATRSLLSAKCSQPELRPDLRAISLTIAADPLHPKLNIYTALIRNAGVTGAGPFEVSLAPPASSGLAAKTRRVNGLPAHATRQVVFQGPACTAANAPTLTLDPAGQVDDFNLRNNSLTVPAGCPAVTNALSSAPATS